MRRLLPLARLLSAPSAVAAEGADPWARLGQALFTDRALSVNGTQSCASCHDPANGFASATAFPEGAVPGHFGNRKPPSLAYQAISPVLHHRIEDGAAVFVGGDMADGRARGASGQPAQDQALMPILNPDEMGLPHAACLAALACASEGAAMEAASPGVCAMPLDAASTCAGPEPAEPAAETLAAVAVVQRAFAAYEASPQVMPFSSRYDDFLAGTGDLSAAEKAGLKLFDGKAQCSACHVLTSGGQGPLLTDFTYDNLGVPRNPENPWYGAVANGKGRDWVDRGLAVTLEADPIYATAAAGVDGAVKVPTLRNVWTGQPRAYMHNGWFKTLEGVVRFYNTRDIWPRCASDWMTEEQAMRARCWPAPEVAATMNRDELGNLKLTEAEEAEIIAFLKTLTDR